MGQIVQAHNIKVDRERVLSRLTDVVASYPNADEARRAYLQNADAMSQIESSVLEEQVVEHVVAHAHVTDRPLTFKELTGFGQTAATAQPG